MFGPDGLLVGFDWSFWPLFWLYFTLTPFAMFVIALVLETRWLPINLRRQYVSFLIGDIFLAWTAALLSVNNQGSVYKPMHIWAGLLLLAATVIVSIVMTNGEYQEAVKKASGNHPDLIAYEVRAVLSPTKLYHNIVLYAGYVFILVMLLAETTLQGTPFWMIMLLLVPALVWLAILILENYLTSDEVKQLRCDGVIGAHIKDWFCIWQKDPNAVE